MWSSQRTRSDRRDETLARCLMSLLRLQGGEKVQTAEEVRRYEYEPPSEPIQFMTDYFGYSAEGGAVGGGCSGLG